MTIATVTMQAPATFGGTVSGTPSGTVYVPDAYGFIYNVPFQDLTVLHALGFTIFSASYGLLAEALAVNLNATGFTAMTMKIPSNRKFRLVKMQAFDMSVASAGAATVLGVFDAASAGNTLIATTGWTLTTLTGTMSLSEQTTLATYGAGNIIAAGKTLNLDIATASGTACTATFRAYGDILSIGE